MRLDCFPVLDTLQGCPQLSYSSLPTSNRDCGVLIILISVQSTYSLAQLFEVYVNEILCCSKVTTHKHPPKTLINVLTTSAVNTVSLDSKIFWNGRTHFLFALTSDRMCPVSLGQMFYP